MVIIGDLIKSSDIAPEHRSMVHKDMLEAICSIAEKSEIYRGDSFQLFLEGHQNLIHQVISLKAALRQHQYDEYDLDARLGLGIGTVTYKTESIRTSDGPVFQRAAKALAAAESTESNIRIASGDAHADAVLNAILGLIDRLTQEWTARQAEIIHWALRGKKQSEIAEILNVSQSTIQRSLSAAHYHILQEIIDYTEDLIRPYEF